MVPFRKIKGPSGPVRLIDADGELVSPVMAFLRELQISLASARQKLAQLTTNATSTHLGMPTFPQIAGRSIPNPDKPT